MAAPVPGRFALPSAAETRIGETVLGRTLTTLAGACNHLTGLHVRGWAAASVYVSEAYASGSASDDGYQTGESDRYETLKIAYYVPPGVDLLHISAWCAAAEIGGSQSPELAVKIVTSGGVDVDKGARWTRAEGSLPGAQWQGLGYHLEPFQAESAPWSAANPLAGETGPRWLSAGAEEGNVVIIEVSTIRCRVLALHVLPVPPVAL